MPPAPLGLEFAPLEPHFLKDPFPFYARLRRESPVTFVPAFHFWLVSRYQDVLSVLKDARTFSSRDTLRPPVELPREVMAILEPAGYRPEYPLLGDDPPSHTRVRALVGKAFTLSRVNALEPRIRELANSYLDTLLHGGPRADLVSRLASPLAMHVMTELLGIPAADRERIKQWCDDEKLFFTPIPLEQHLRAARGVADFRRYLRQLVEDRRRSPREDLITSLLEARAEGERPLNTDELVALACVLVFAGHETSTNLLALACYHLLRHPGLWQELRKAPYLIRNALEESMRYDSPVVGMMRTTNGPVQLGGTELPAGARLFLLFASANRDESVFEGGERFDLHRASAVRHLGLGHGIHYCVGAPVARLEAQVLLELMVQRLPELRLSPGEHISYLPNLVHRVPRHLQVQWGA
ncbi:cytochrome P450 [Vitiosangium sp. GDMCC 1.1324]|uniref:cytochrome P450 n=1 Tax=Vitiosangium sp. (strain GDMCC 1.1324) TaxID=2138576 RepID=UPI000D39D9F8|nr:cytochrome P450 [Vitiosangium sp. GDMCC 1.1324]PTL76574.1 cytochrome P450 [Vitiosangium sp. GDMCC 1.1324]